MFNPHALLHAGHGVNPSMFNAAAHGGLVKKMWSYGYHSYESAGGPGLAHGKWTWGGNLVMAPIIAYQVSHAQRGDVIPTLATETVGLGLYPIFAGFIGLGIGILSGGRIPPGVASLIAGFAAGVPEHIVSEPLHRSIRWISGTQRRVARLQMGGDFKDTTTAQQIRARSIAEMSSAMGASRRWLGQEALYFHQ